MNRPGTGPVQLASEEQRSFVSPATLARKIKRVCRHVPGYLEPWAWKIRKKSVELAQLLQEVYPLDGEDFEGQINGSYGLLEEILQWFQLHQRDPTWKKMRDFTRKLEGHLEYFKISTSPSHPSLIETLSDQYNRDLGALRDLLMSANSKQERPSDDEITKLTEMGEEALRRMDEVLNAPVILGNLATILRRRRIQCEIAQLSRKMAILLTNSRGGLTVREVVETQPTASDRRKGSWSLRTVETEVALRTTKIEAEHILLHLSKWAQLSNEHIILFYGYAAVGGLSLVSPWIPSHNVLEYIREQGDADKMVLLLEAAKGLEFLHSCDMIHGDVRCSNIMVSEHGEACIGNLVVFMDIAGETTDEAGETAAGSLISSNSSLEWQAPEIEFRGQRPSKASDIYSFGMTVLELLTEQHPFRRPQPDFMKMTTVPHYLRHHALLTENLWNFLRECWQTKSKPRPLIVDVVAALKKF